MVIPPVLTGRFDFDAAMKYKSVKMPEKRTAYQAAISPPERAQTLVMLLTMLRRTFLSIPTAPVRPTTLKSANLKTPPARERLFVWLSSNMKPTRRQTQRNGYK
jgi:hypothetical protein